MMAWSVSFIVIFGIAALIPAVWSVVGLARGNTRFWPAVVGTVWAALLLLGTFIGIGTNWGGCPSSGASSKGAITCTTGDTVSGCQPDIWALECRATTTGCSATIPSGSFCSTAQEPVFDFCERIQPGGVKQPWATWSDFSFIAAGLWLLWFFQYFARPGTSTTGTTVVTTTADNPMITVGWLSVTYGMIVIFMGPPSMWFHASMKDWAGWFDSMSVVLWLTFNAVYVSYAFGAMWGGGRGAARPITVLGIWAVLCTVFGIVALSPAARLWGYVISGALWGIAEVLYICFAAFHPSVVYRRTWWMFLVNFALLGITMTLWVLFNNAVISPSDCRDREGFPGHALFHILASLSTVWTFVSFASERKVSA